MEAGGEMKEIKNGGISRGMNRVRIRTWKGIFSIYIKQGKNLPENLLKWLVVLN